MGAGLAGLSAADALVAAGHAVALFDKGRGPGGRMSTRRVERDGTTLAFDHGAQYLTARYAAFAEQVAAWEAAGIVARWPAAGPDALVGTPGMNAPVRALAARHAVAWNTRIDALTREGAGWSFAGERFDTAIVAVPAEQAATLLGDHPFAATARATPTQPCWTVMAAFDQPVPAPDIVRDAGAISWAARDGAKPGRAGTETWVIQASPDWSVLHLEDNADTVAAALLRAWAAACGIDQPQPLHLLAHRWRYARSGGSGDRALWNAESRLGVCGDWLIGPRVEAAWLSGRQIAARIAAS